MYKLDSDSPTLKTYGNQEYDETYLEKLIDGSIRFSGETRNIMQWFNDNGIISTHDWKFYDWALLCIGYCLAETKSPEDWIQPNDEKGTEVPSLRTLFQDKFTFWTAYFSRIMFRHNPQKTDFERADLIKFIRTACHTGAIKLKERYEKLSVAYPEPWKTKTEFLRELTEKAKKNLPDKISAKNEENEAGSKNTETEPLIQRLENKLSLKQNIKASLESLELLSEGPRYNVYGATFSTKVKQNILLDNISDGLGIPSEHVICTQWIGKAHGWEIKILRDKTTWKSYETNEFKSALKRYKGKFKLPVCIGLDESGKPVFRDYTEAPHTIVGGTTGSGKTVFVRSMLHSLFELNDSNILEIAILDPKKVDYKEFKDRENLYEGNIVTETNQMLKVLNKMVKEMDERYSLMEQKGKSNISELPKSERPPYIIVVVDEVADLLDEKGEEAETPLIRLAQKARACGIFLLLATQRPDAKTLEGRLRDNLPTKIALKVGKRQSSDIILGESGAEKLAGS